MSSGTEPGEPGLQIQVCWSGPDTICEEENTWFCIKILKRLYSDHVFLNGRIRIRVRSKQPGRDKNPSEMYDYLVANPASIH